MEITKSPEVQGLAELKSTVGSKPWFLQQGKIEDVARMDDQIKSAKQRLKTIYDKLPEQDVINYAEISSRAGDPVFCELALVKAHYDCIVLGGPLTKYLKESALENRAVLLRDELTKAKREGKTNLVGLLEESSRKYYEDYKSAAERRMGFTRETSVDSNIGFKYVSNNVARAYRHETDMLGLIGSGGRSLIPGVDNNWLRVYCNVYPNEKNYPLAYEAFRSLRMSAARNFGVDIVDLNNYADFVEGKALNKTGAVK